MQNNFSKFYKYNSLGNDFILFDFYNKNFCLKDFLEKNDSTFRNFVSQICHRHFGIGADGVLILTKNLNINLPEAFIFNSDGSSAQICLNGIRCISKHLFNFYNFPENFDLQMGGKIINCFITKKDTDLEITNKIPAAKYIGQKELKILDNNFTDHLTGHFTGHIVDIGNPHFIIFKQIEFDWLNKYGKLIESHKEFSQKTNVEFIWPEKNISENNLNKYNLLVYERGAGITLACSSGAASVCWALYILQKIKIEQEIILTMLGGKLLAKIDLDKNIILKASAHLVYDGQIMDLFIPLFLL